MIKKADLDRLMNSARVHLTGASDAGITLELFDTINEFFDGSNAWFEWMQLPIIAGQQAYQIYPTHGGMVVRLSCVFDTNRVPLPAHMAEITPPGAKIWLIHPQNNNQTGNLMVIKNTTLPNSRDEIPDAPDWLLPVYERYILEGLLGRMMTQPGKSYSNDTKATYHLKKFRDGIAMAKTAVARSNLVGAQSWFFPSQYRTVSQRSNIGTAFPGDSRF
jgi:hypothetical protein